MKKEELQKEISLKDKARFFASYWGQEVFSKTHGATTYILDYVRLGSISDSSIIELKPLSQISEEDAVSVANIVGWVKGKNPSEYKSWVIDFFGDRSLGDRFSLIPELPIYHSLELIDFLRSKGHALPWMGLSVEQLIEYGWIKLKED